MAGMANALSGQKTSEYGQGVIEWSLLVCIPVALGDIHADHLCSVPYHISDFFAAILGRTMKFVAQFKLERGSSIDVSNR
jgi:hypothetical protein